MKPEFSFNYGEKRYVFSAENNAKYELESGISVSVEAKSYKEYNAVEWVLWLENSSDSNSAIFSDIWDCDTLLPLKYPEVKRPGYMPKEGDACVITMNGSVDGAYYWSDDSVSATEFALRREYLSSGTKVFCCIGGRSSAGTVPIFDVTALGSGYICAVGWTGDWRAEFTRCDDGVRVTSGLKNARFYLKPGERLRTTSALVMSYDENEDKYNKFRALIRNHLSHKSTHPSSRDGLMAFELWGGLTSAEMIKRINELKDHGIRFEDIWIDAGWYGECTKCDDAFSGDWSECTGDWRTNPRVHPDGLFDVSRAAKDAGARIMLWFEPERAVKKAVITKEHPDWFLTNESNVSLILNYGVDEAREYVYGLVSEYVERLDLSCYRQDFNVDVAKWFEGADEEDRIGITEIRHITGMYRLWDDLLERFPDLIIDNCASGGRRIDIETLKRSIPFFRSDYQCNFNENPEVLQTHNSCISHYIPYNGCTSKTKRDTYAIRSAYSSSFGGAFYNAIFQSFDEEDFKWAKSVADEYLSIRRYFPMDYYNHGSSVFDDTAWTIWQYHDPDTQSGIVMAFRRENSPFEEVKIDLKGILSDRAYSYLNLSDGSTQDGDGRVTIKLPEKRSSVIFEYKIK